MLSQDSNPTRRAIAGRKSRSGLGITKIVILLLLLSSLISIFLHIKLDHTLTRKQSIFFNFEKPTLNQQFAKIRNKIQLSCDAHNGPFESEAVEEIIYWRDDIPAVQQFESPSLSENQYILLEPDRAGFNNVRLTFETTVALAKATGRTLVLPPAVRVSQFLAIQPVRSYRYTDFFQITNVPMITFEEFLEREAMTGNLKDKNGNVPFPPMNRTNWNGLIGNSRNSGIGDADLLWNWITEVTTMVDWNRVECVVYFPSTKHAKLPAALDQIITAKANRINTYVDNPTPVNASEYDRFREMIGTRKRVCYYNETLEQAKAIFFTGQEKTGKRPLIQFYAYFFFQDWQKDLQMKRFIRDNLRYVDVIHCVAARIVQAIRKEDLKKGGSGTFDSMHIRRKDFLSQPTYKESVVDAEKIVQEHFFDENRTIYIATDEKNISFFDPFRKNYRIMFLSDLKYLLNDLDPNFYGMVEQLICSRGQTFVGTYYSTFSAYVNRIRGYHALKHGILGADRGVLDSLYLGQKGWFRDSMKRYTALEKDFWVREWPTAWRDIDFDVIS